MKQFDATIKSAFTLLEMLVVIGITALILGLGAISYSSMQKKARDTKRKTDLKTIQNALEQYYSLCNYQYPFSDPFSAAGNLTGNLACGSTTLLSYPTDPLSNLYYYQCVGTCSSSQYTICPSDSVNIAKRLETEDCSGLQCCLQSQQ